MVLVFDYDGTIVKNSWPGVGKLRWLAKPILRWLKRGATLILYTCREGTYLNAAVGYLAYHGIEFNYCNENAKELIDLYQHDPRKISGDFIFDDKAGFWGWWTVPFIVFWLNLRGVK